MKPIENFKAEKSKQKSKLPVGGYVLEICKAEIVDYSWGSQLVLTVDVAEGEHKGFFLKDYAAQTGENRKFRGTFRLRVPNENDQYYESEKRQFGNAVWAIEESNPGFSWDWDEKKLYKPKHLLVGGLWRNREWEKDGKTGWMTECCTLASADEIRKGEFQMPKDKPLTGAKKAAAETSRKLAEPDDDEELPWGN